MRVVVSGSRKLRNIHGEIVAQEIRSLPRNAIVVHGWCDGADCLADGAATSYGNPVERWPVDWNAAKRILGRRWKFAGPLRNGWMLHAAPTDLLIAFPLPGGTGTPDMIRQARRAGVPVRVVNVEAKS